MNTECEFDVGIQSYRNPVPALTYCPRGRGDNRQSDATRKGQTPIADLFSAVLGETAPLVLTLDRLHPLHFIGVGGIGMSALAGILAARGYKVSGSDARESPTLDRLRSNGVRLFSHQSAETISVLRQNNSPDPVAVISTAVPPTNPELMEAHKAGLTIAHRSDVLAALINNQPSIAVAGSHGKTTTSTLIATLLEAVNLDPTAVIGGIVPAFGSNARHGRGRLLVAEADESDGSLVKFAPQLAVLTNVELDHTDHYPDLQSLIDTLQKFVCASKALLANYDCPILRKHFSADNWWSTETIEGATFSAIATDERGDGTSAEFHENGTHLGPIELPLPGRHNLSNATAALGVCRLEGVAFSDLQKALAALRSPIRRFEFRGAWRGRLVVDDYAHHPSEVATTVRMARLMVKTGQSPFPLPPRRLVAVFQPHRYSRTAQFLEAFAHALAKADLVLLAPLYSAGESPIEGVSSTALALTLQHLMPNLPVLVADSLQHLAQQVASSTQRGDLVLAMGAGDINSLWKQLDALDLHDGSPALVA